MKVLVLVKEVAELAEDFEISDLVIKERYKEHVLNEWDEYAIETAVQISEERSEEVEIVSATIGPETCEETIRLALAKDVDRAIRFWDDIFSQDIVDARVRATVLEAIVDREKPDLILTGVQADDDGFGVTGVMLAERIGFHWAAVVNHLQLTEDTARVRRELEGGVEEVASVPLPAVLTIQTGINDPRYASLRGIRQAKRKEIEEIDLADLDLDSDHFTQQLERRSLVKPESESDMVRFEGEADEVASELAELLRERRVDA
ncbi:electron transfer flavoprotein subunit beta/FixA family protein [Haladaptatus cibarius]|uniref:electron transfer flavoprotein subunit beta/FixA family protein n=1 Tax=Haladaptatus cibarius TaxID=453847 RepID=UPI000678657C|nr:electron transfer flavoprotein subunit beta/FixA family protein [Haladaptatus cibarius]